MFADRFSLTSGIFGWVSNIDLNYVGYAIVALFVITWAIALSAWHYRPHRGEVDCRSRSHWLRSRRAFALLH